MKTSEEDMVVKSNHRTVKASTTLSRKYTKRPKMGNSITVSVKKSPQVNRFAQNENMMMQGQQEQQGQNEQQQTQQMADVMMPAEAHPMQQTANMRMKMRGQKMQSQRQQKMSAKELKDQAIKKALAAASNMTEQQQPQARQKSVKVKNPIHFGFGRVMLALGCATAAVAAIVYFVNLNMPDISLRVAAMQTGMDPSYPNYVPRDYTLSGITSEESRITMEFVNTNENTKFTLIEEKSSWDSNALLTNFVKNEYEEDYTIVREQGLTIYISGSNAAWVNGGNVFKIKSPRGTLTNKQIKSIAVSL